MVKSKYQTISLQHDTYMNMVELRNDIQVLSLRSGLENRVTWDEIVAMLLKLSNIEKIKKTIIDNKRTCIAHELNEKK